MKRNLFVAVLVMLLILWGAITLFYHLGASGVSFGGSSVSFDREHDRTMLRLRDDVGLDIHFSGGSPPRFDLLGVTRASFPFCPLCGTYKTHGAVVLDAAFHHGDWFFRAPDDRPLAKGARAENLRGLAYNTATGARLEMADGASADTQRKQLAAVQLDASPANRITPQALAGLSSLSMVQDSCLVFNAAFIFLLGAWLVGGLLVFVVRRVRR